MIIFKIERPSFWTSFLPVTCIKGMPAAMFWRHCAHAFVRGNKIPWRIMSKLLGFWPRSNLALLNPCETVQIQRKTMFMRVKMGAEEEIKYIVMCIRVLYDRELRRATQERMFMLQGDWGSRKLNFRWILLLYSADVNYFGTRKIINSHRLGDLFHLFRISLWCVLRAQMAAKIILCLVAM